MLFVSVLCSSSVLGREHERVEGLEGLVGLGSSLLQGILGTTRGERRVEEEEDSIEARFFLQEKLCSLGLAEVNSSSHF